MRGFLYEPKTICLILTEGRARGLVIPPALAYISFCVAARFVRRHISPGLTHSFGSCSFPGSWAWGHGAHLHSRFSGIAHSPTAVVARSFFFVSTLISLMRLCFAIFFRLQHTIYGYGVVRCVLISHDIENAGCKLAKREVRKAGLAARATLSPVERIERSLSLVGFAGELNVVPGSVIAGFWPIRDEVDPRPLMDALAKNGCSLCLPVVIGDDLEFRRLDKDGSLEPADFGIMAPGAEAEVVHPNVVLTPLSAFDRNCNRIGYGKGFYDHALSELEKLTDLTAIGVAFAVQEVEEVPMEPHDRKLDSILTDHGLLKACD